MNLETFFPTDENEQPLDHMVTDGGYCGIFRTIACVGDSMASGDLESCMNGEVGYHDYYDYSWGQYIARMAGCKVYNFSRGGMSAREYCNTFSHANALWDVSKAAQAYIIALGANDLFVLGHKLGSLADICLEDYTKNADTYYGNFAKIIQKYKEVQPKARFFLVTLPRDKEIPKDIEIAQTQVQAMHEIADLFDYTYLIDLHKYGPDFDAEFRKKFYVGNHMNALGYELSARMIASYIDYIIRHNIADFSQIGFVGTPYYNENSPW